MNLTLNATTAQIQAAMTAAGLPMPTPVLEAQALGIKLRESVQRDIHDSHEQLATAYCAAVAADREPSEDPDVQRLIAATFLTGSGELVAAVETRATSAVFDAVLDSRTTMVAAWSKAFAKCATVMASAHQRIGDLPLDNTTEIMRAGGDIADVWARARQADSTIDTILSGWTALALFMRKSVRPDRHSLLRICDVDPQHWRDHQLTGTKLSAWDALRAGYDISLPTFEEYARRVAAVEAAVNAPVLEVNRMRSAIAGREITEAVA